MTLKVVVIISLIVLELLSIAMARLLTEIDLEITNKETYLDALKVDKRLTVIIEATAIIFVAVLLNLICNKLLFAVFGYEAFAVWTIRKIRQEEENRFKEKMREFSKGEEE